MHAGAARHPLGSLDNTGKMEGTTRNNAIATALEIPDHNTCRNREPLPERDGSSLGPSAGGASEPQEPARSISRRQLVAQRVAEQLHADQDPRAGSLQGPLPEISEIASVEPPRDPNTPVMPMMQARNREQSDMRHVPGEAATAEPQTRVAGKALESYSQANDVSDSPWSSMYMLFKREFWSTLAQATRELYEGQLFNLLDLAGAAWTVGAILFAVLVQPWILFVIKLARCLLAAVSIDAVTGTLWDPPPQRRTGEHPATDFGYTRPQHTQLRSLYDGEMGDANAQAVCWARAMIAAAPEDRTEFRVDPQINKFEPSFLSWWLRLALAVFRQFPKALTHFKNRAALILTARTLAFDNLFETAILNFAVRQIVILGAGYDTRAYRFAALRRQFGVRVIEIDQRSVQRHKTQCLKKKFAPSSVAQHDAVAEKDSTMRTSDAMISRRGSLQDADGISFDVVYCACNFESSKALHEALTEAGFNPELTTAFFMEGVAYYLSADALRTTLRTIASFRRASTSGPLSPGSSCCSLFLPEWYFYFDYHGSNTAGAIDASFDVAMMKVVALGMKLQGKPVRLGLPSSRFHLAETLAAAEAADFKVDRTTSFLKLVDQYCPRLDSLFQNNPVTLAECRWPPVSVLQTRNLSTPAAAANSMPSTTVAPPQLSSINKPAT